MLRCLTQRQLTEWAAFYAIDPFGEERADLRNAMLMAQTANMHRDDKKHPNPFPLSEFMPFAERPEPPKQTTADLKAWFARHAIKKG